jgi:hypothetical protein
MLIFVSQILPMTSDAFTTLFAAFRAPAQLLSHQGTPGSVAPLHAYVSAMVDSVVYLAAKAWRQAALIDAANTSAEQAAKTIARDEVSRLWKEGVLETASKSNRPQNAVTIDCKEQAHLIGKGLARLMAISEGRRPVLCLATHADNLPPPELTSESLPIIGESTLNSCLPGETTMDKAVLRAVLPILGSFQRGQTENSPIRTLVSNVITQLGELCVRYLSSSIAALTEQHSTELDAAVDLVVSLLHSESPAARQDLSSVSASRYLDLTHRLTRRDLRNSGRFSQIRRPSHHSHHRAWDL